MGKSLIVGCGNIGFRHLQALIALDGPQATAITVIEPQEQNHERILAELARLPQAQSGDSRLLASLPDGSGPFDLAILATNSAQRRAAYEEVREKAVLKTVVLEKVLFPRLLDLDEVGGRLDLDKTAAFVNCGRRIAPGYQALRDRARQQGKVDIEISGTAWGLGSNAIHFLDMAEFVNGSQMVSLDATGLLPGHEPSKRGGYVEIFGTIRSTLANGATISIRCDRGETPRVEVQARCGDAILAINEAGQTVRRLPDGAADPFPMRHVSELTETYAEILTSGTCSLTPYAESVRQHRFFLTGILEHLDLPVVPTTACPVS